MLNRRLDAGRKSGRRNWTPRTLGPMPSAELSDESPAPGVLVRVRSVADDVAFTLSGERLVVGLRAVRDQVLDERGS